MLSKLKTLLAFAERGVGILPLTPSDNAPVVAGGTIAAVTNPKTLRRFYKKRPKHNFGLAVGDGVFVICVNDNRSKSRLHKLAAKHGERLPKTVTLRIDKTRLYLFAAKGMQVSTGLIEKGIDVLGRGEYVPGPGSSLPSGGKSRFASGRTLSDTEIAVGPTWLLGLIDAVPADANAAVARSASKVGNDAGDQRVTPRAAPSPGPSGEAPDLDARPAAAETGVKGDTERAAGMATSAPVPFHPLAGIFPLIDQGHLRELALDIAVHGQVDLIVLYEGKILDGRGRYLACKMAEVEPKFETFAGGDPLDYVMRRNALRRHLNEAQRAMAAAKAADQKRGANQHSEGLPIGRAAALLNIGERSVARAREVLRGGVPELVTAVEAGEIAVSAAADISGTPETEQRKMVACISGGSTNADGQARIKKADKAARHKTGKSKNQRGAGPGDVVPAAEVEKLKSELAAANERQRKLEEELEIARVTALESRAASSIKISPDLEIPPFLDRRPLADDQAAFDSIMAAWTNSAAPDALLRASPVVQERFTATVRAEMASARSATN
jgi:hypothetical protein